MNSSFTSLRKAYTATSLLLLTLVLFFVVFNIIAYAAYKLLNNFFYPHQVVRKYGTETLRAAYPALDEQTWKSLINESHNIPLEFEPYTQFRERPTQGKWVNIHAAGFRLGSEPLPWPVKRTADDFIVFVFGGSTTFGYGLSDRETIPAQLGRHLSEQAGRAVKVYNFGRGSYYSTQERILFERLLVAGNVPDLAVFIDGLNDFYYHEDVPEFRKFFAKVMQPERSKDAWTHILGKLPVVRLSNRLAELRNPAGVIDPANEPPSDDPLTLDTVIARYSDTQKIIRAVASPFAVKTLFVWQPVPHYRYNQEFHPFAASGYGKHTYSLHGYPRMQSLLSRQPPSPDFLDLSHIQETLQQPLYVDLVHYNALLCDTIAGQIADHLIRAEKTGTKDHKGLLSSPK